MKPSPSSPASPQHSKAPMGVLLMYLVALTLSGCGSSDVPVATSELRPRGSTEADASEARRLGVPLSIAPAHGSDLVFVPHGSFEMGADPNAHQVDLELAFYVQRKPFTAGALRTLAGACELSSVLTPQAMSGSAGEIAQVTRGEALIVADALTKLDPVWEYALPTEAQWEYVFTKHATSGDVHNVNQSKRNLTWEWTRDRFGPQPDWRVINPTGPVGGNAFVCKGGGNALAARRETSAATRAALRLVVHVGYGLGTYGSVPVTFVLSHDTDSTGSEGHADPETQNETTVLRFVRMQERLAARSQGHEPIWALSAVQENTTVLTMVPGRYYVYSERGRGDSHRRGIEIKFTVRGNPLEVDVPVPQTNMKRYGESRPQ